MIDDDKMTDVFREAEQAFCDCYGSHKQESRSLHFRASSPVSREDAFDIMSHCTPEGYNDFAADAIKFLPADSQIVIAREYSVCLYVKGDLTELNDKLHADECDFNEETNETRFWWD